jgi:hypothetical protein
MQRDLDKLTLPLFCTWPLKFPSYPLSTIINLFFFLWELASVDTNSLLILTFPGSNGSGKSPIFNRRVDSADILLREKWRISSIGIGMQKVEHQLFS